MFKAGALAQIALDQNFLSHPEVTIHYYLWVLSDIITSAIQTREAALNDLMKNKKEAGRTS